MDKATLESLKAALGQSPDNLVLKMLLAKGLLENGAGEEAFGLIAGVSPAALSEADRLTAANIALAKGEAARALVFASSDAPEALLLKARACLLLFDYKTGFEVYNKAVAG